jgi:predicted MFS family arabinose efflux permease
MSKTLPVQLTAQELRIVRLIMAIQFINILDFMMVMPLGPDFARALGIPTSHIGFIGGAYTAAAFLSGLAGSLYLDRLDRRKALALAMVGLVIGTAAGGFAIGLGTLMAARIIAGLCGGPATALAQAIIADQIPPERRGRAMGMVAGGFALASVVGVPVGLKLAELGGWRTPFFAVASLGLLIVFAVARIMPAQNRHLADLPPFDLKQRFAALREIMRRPICRIGLAASFFGIAGHFLLIPNMSAYFQFNLGYLRDQLAWLYAAGGCISFFSMRYAGRMVDRLGATRVILFISVGVITIYYALFLHYIPIFPVLLLFTLFMTFNAARFVVINTTTSKVPLPHERAGFMSLSSATQSLGSSVAAFVSSLILVGRPDGSLGNMPALTSLSIAVALLVPVLIWQIEKRLPARKPDIAVEDAVKMVGVE